MKVKENKMLAYLGYIFVRECGFDTKSISYVKSDLFDGMYLACYSFKQNNKKYMLVINYEEKIDELVLSIQDSKNVLFSNFTSLRKFTTRATDDSVREILPDGEMIKVCKENDWTDFIKYMTRSE